MPTMSWTSGLALLPFVLLLVASAGSADSIRDISRKGDVFTYLFQWKWTEVAEECENVLGPAGYRAVCVDPPLEHKKGSAWYVKYQPVSHQLISQGGTPEEFKDMIHRCHAAGLEVYADLLLNHMASGEGVGTAGTHYTRRNFSLFSPSDFHEPCALDDWTDRRKMQTCDLLGLPDLDTGAAGVRTKLIGLLQYLSDLGLDGIRVDAARHMSASDLRAILSPVTGSLKFAMHEDVYEGIFGDPVHPSEYYDVALGGHTGESRMMAFESASYVGDAFMSGNLASLTKFGIGGNFPPSDKSVTFTDNHDIQRHTFNIREGRCPTCNGVKGCRGYCIYYAMQAMYHADGALHELGNAFLLAHDYGYPCLMSSYAFSDAGQGRPNDVPCSKGSSWVCEHRRASMHKMIRFRRLTAGAPVTAFSITEGGEALAFARAGLGFFALNIGDTPWRTSLQTTLAEGSYENLINGHDVVVDLNGFAELDVPALGLVALVGPARMSTRPDGYENRVSGDDVIVDSVGVADLSMPALGHVASAAPTPTLTVNSLRRRRMLQTMLLHAA